MTKKAQGVLNIPTSPATTPVSDGGTVRLRCDGTDLLASVNGSAYAAITIGGPGGADGNLQWNDGGVFNGVADTSVNGGGLVVFDTRLLFTPTNGPDASAAGALVLGGTTATQVQVGRVGIQSVFPGNVVTVNNELQVQGQIDRATAGALTIAGVAPTATSVVIGDGAITIDMLGTVAIASSGGSCGFFDATPIAQDAGWSVSNLTPQRSYDADTITLPELADVVGTLITVLLETTGYGLLGT